jgi:transposase
MNTAHVRKRAEVIMKVRCGLLTATQAAKELGVSRKTYYKWEKRGLSALLDGLAEKDSGRPSPPQDSHQQELQHQIEQLRRDNDLLTQKMALKDILNDLKLKTGKRRSEKK